MNHQRPTNVPRACGGKDGLGPSPAGGQQLDVEGHQAKETTRPPAKRDSARWLAVVQTIGTVATLGVVLIKFVQSLLGR